MTREEIYQQCVEKIAKTNCLLLESATGTGKSKISIDLVNYLLASLWYRNKEEVNILLLVAKRVHKQTWKEEIEKWGGINHPTAHINICMECYESLKNHCRERWDIVLADEVHHIGSDVRLDLLKTVRFGYFIGLSATIPVKLKQLFRYRYHADVVSCDIIEAINDEILPEPQILLFPLMLDNRKPTETWEFFKEAPGPVVHAEYREIRKYKYNRKVHSIILMTQKQKCMEFDALIDFFKRNNRDKAMLYMAGKRLEFLAYCKNQIVSDILRKLDKKRTITFCKTIEQSEILGKNCIHSQNKKADDLYERFNSKRINHITAVNILNENANLVDCQYGIFANISSSSIVQAQRTGRLLRHKEPVIIIPYYKGTREDEIVAKMLEGFNKEFIKEIHSIQEI